MNPGRRDDSFLRWTVDPGVNPFYPCLLYECTEVLSNGGLGTTERLGNFGDRLSLLKVRERPFGGADRRTSDRRGWRGVRLERVVDCQAKLLRKPGHKVEHRGPEVAQLRLADAGDHVEQLGPRRAHATDVAQGRVVEDRVRRHAPVRCGLAPPGP